MNSTTQKGLLTELYCQTDFSNCGILLSQPIINDSRYDYVADINGKFYRIQCKSCLPTESGDAISFNCSNKNWNSGVYKTYKGAIDFFYTYYNGKGYLISVDDTPNRCKTLRFSSDQPNNKNISWAKDYEFEKVIISLGASIQKIEQNYIKQIKSESVCVDCGKSISYNSVRCKKCNNAHLSEIRWHESNIPERDELKNGIRKYSFLELSKKYNVSDETVRNWCDVYELPRSKSKINMYSEEDWGLL